MLGADLLRYLSTQGESAQGFHRGNIDLSDKGKSQIAQLGSYDVVVNCVAYTNVDKAEVEPDLAHEINVELPVRIASSINSEATKFIQISTDYVFDGRKSTPYSAFDPANPINVYGRTKREAEIQLLEKFDNTQIVRTAWLYGKHGSCFPRTLQSIGETKDAIKVVNDQYGTPTHTLSVAEFLYHLQIDGNEQQIVHAVSSGTTSWFRFAELILRDIGWPGELIPISSAELGQRAKRPKQSALEPTTLSNFIIPDWRTSWLNSSTSVLGI